MEDARIVVSSVGTNRIGLTGFTERQVGIFEGIITGGGGIWFEGGPNGKIRLVTRFEEFPSPVADSEMREFWVRPEAQEHRPEPTGQINFRPLREVRGNESPSIYIHNLGRDDTSMETYRKNADLLESYNFECLRGRRRPSGRFTEKWCLEDISIATGDLGKAVAQKQTPKEILVEAINFLYAHVRCGKIEVCARRFIKC
jgi:hypothetical protein